uniref:Uncharacterized protein n=1 Tax=Anguilla anguilla TaxID=7936 RepID=A0A0E9TFX2_ANGAN
MNSDPVTPDSTW